MQRCTAIFAILAFEQAVVQAQFSGLRSVFLSSSAIATKQSREMLVNADFSNGMSNWKVEESGATGSPQIVPEGPKGKAALRLKVLTVSDSPWRLQIYHAGVAMDKAKRYELSFWVKSDQKGIFTVNCMQNHAPWEHHGAAKEMPLTQAWTRIRFAFDGPWDDANARITFTNLGTVPGQTYWFAQCSLKEIGKAKTAQATYLVSAGKRIVVWDGEKVNIGSGWANPKSSSILRAPGTAHSGNSAMEFKFKTSKIWVGAGWDWFAWKTGTNVGTDTRGMKNLTFWIKSKGTSGDLQVQLQCNGDILDTPEHHTIKVVVGKYCKQFRDGNWHEVVIPLADLTQPEGYDPKIVSQIQFGFMAEGEVDGSFLIDDIAFDDR